VTATYSVFSRQKSFDWILIVQQLVGQLPRLIGMDIGANCVSGDRTIVGARHGTGQNKADLTACADNILLAREARFPATTADLYDPEAMPDNLRAAHERKDETLERIYIGRRFKNDTERPEKLFELYTKMTATAKGKPAAKTVRGKATS
jgi:hypothetical protein